MLTILTRRELELTNYGKGDTMMPLTVADAGTDYIVKRIGGKPEVKKHLENLGFIVGTGVSVITIIGGNVIVKVKESRVAISREMAQKIMI